MTKIALTDVESLANEQTFLTTYNANNALIEEGSDKFLSRDGTSPNSMEDNLDMDSFRIINLPPPVSNTEPLRVADVVTDDATVTVNAGLIPNDIGLNEDLTDHDAEEAGYVYLSTDGDGDTITDPVIYVKLSDTNADWSSAIELKGDKGDTGSTGSAGTDGVDAYVYIAYASDSSGTGFTTTFDADLDYVAIKSTTTEIVSPAASDFSGLWKNYKGATGSTGATGTAATIAVGTVTTGDPGSDVTVTNSGTSSAAVLDFSIPQGAGVGLYAILSHASNGGF
jgi:hypothetical protein